MIFSGINSTFASFKNSQVEKISNIKISNMNKALSAVNSNITEFSDSQISENHSTSPGGAISMLNSRLSISNSTFMTNSASEGGAIMFECTSLQN